MAETARLVWRDYVTNNVPASGDHEPKKDKIRIWGGDLENAVSALVLSTNAAVVKGTKAELDAVLGSYEVGDIGLVITDPTESLRGVYKREPAFWSKQADLPSDVAQIAADNASASETAAALAKVAAEAARDQAAGYVTDIASEKEVPIYSTVDGLAAVTVEPGISTIRVNGGGAQGDGNGGLFNAVATEPEHFSRAKSAGGRNWELKGIDVNFHNSLIAEIANDMYLGGTVLGAEIGDSTTVGADPLNSDNGFLADFPAPAEMERMLRNWYSASSITIQNMGINGFDTYGFLSGADGVIPDYAEKIAILKVSGCRFVVINLGMNDMQDATPTTTRNFKFNLIAMERIARATGMAVIFKTPNPAFGGPSPGSMSKAERSKHYSQIVRDVCRATGALLCDVYNLVLHAFNNRLLQETIPDSIHPTNEAAGVYRAIGQLAAGLFCHPQAGVNGPDQFITAGGPNSACLPFAEAAASPNTRTGLELISTSAAGAKTLSMLAKIDVPGLDLYLAHPIWADGAASVTVLLDGINVQTISQFVADGFGSGHIKGQEVLVLRNAPVGLHIIQLSVASGPGAVGANWLRTRSTHGARVLTNPGGSIAPRALRWRKVIEDDGFTEDDGSSNSIVLFDDIPTSRLNDGIDIEITANLAKGEGIVLHGVWAANNFTAGAAFGASVAGLMLCLHETTGYPTLREASGYSTFASTTLAVGGVPSTTDMSGVERTYRIAIPAGLGAAAKVIIGATTYDNVTLTKPYVGGLLGMRRAGNGTMNVKRVRMMDPHL